jgi:predicted nucleic acid-binding protein
MLVVDSNVALAACAARRGFERFRREELIAPPLMWTEFRSALHEAVWRREISDELASKSLDRLASWSVRQEEPRELGKEAWRIADVLGHAKSYDAEYLALASLFGCRVVTLDGRLVRSARKLGMVITPEEL